MSKQTVLESGTGYRSRTVREAYQIIIK